MSVSWPRATQNQTRGPIEAQNHMATRTVPNRKNNNNKTPSPVVLALSGNQHNIRDSKFAHVSNAKTTLLQTRTEEQEQFMFTYTGRIPQNNMQTHNLNMASRGSHRPRLLPSRKKQHKDELAVHQLPSTSSSSARF